MNNLHRAMLLLIASAPGCASLAGTSPASPGSAPMALALTYSPQPSPLTYTATDSGNVRMDIPGMGGLDVVFDLATTSRLALARAPGGLDATLTITSLKGQMSNPQAGNTAVDNSLIPGEPGRMSITPAGHITRAALPELSRSLREVTTASTLFYGLFIRLPEGPVRPGATWVDTVDVTDQLGALSMTQRHEIRSTYAGDTVIAGRRLARITGTSAITMNLSGDAGGVQIEQRLLGQGVQASLWDAARGVLVERRVESNATGSMSVAGAQIGEIPVTQRSRSLIRLQPGG